MKADVLTAMLQSSSQHVCSDEDCSMVIETSAFILEVFFVGLSINLLYHTSCRKCYILIYVTRSKKTDHFVIMQVVQYGPKALPRSQSQDFAISMPQCSTIS